MSLLEHHRNRIIECVLFLCLASGENVEALAKCRMPGGYCAGESCIDYFIESSQ